MFRKILKKVKSFNLACILSEDANTSSGFHELSAGPVPQAYKEELQKLPLLFQADKVGCHRYCLKCGAGTYIQCSPPLPGLL